AGQRWGAANHGRPRSKVTRICYHPGPAGLLPAAPARRWFGLAYALLLPFALAPLFATHFLPGLDLPFHLSLVDMLRKLSAADSPYREVYESKLRLAPYSAYFASLYALSFLFSL